jgi:hypothetical protein
MKKRSYKSKEDKYFIGFQPPEVFEKIQNDKELKKYYQQYRNHHKLISEGKENLLQMKKKLDKIRIEIKGKEKQIKDWNGKMLTGYSIIGDLSKDYDFNCSVNLRKIKPRRLIMIEKGLEHTMKKHYDSSDIYGDTTKRGTERNNPSHENKMRNMEDMGGKTFTQTQKDSERLKGREIYDPQRNLTITEKYYIRFEPKLKRRRRDIEKRWIRNLYVGQRDEVINLLKTYNKDIKWEGKDEKYIRDNLREIYKGYGRYMISEHGIKNFKVGSKTNEISQHPFEKVRDWIGEMGDKVFEWMDQ